MKAVIVDDEQLAIEVLEILLRRIKGVDVVGTYINPLVAIKEIEKLEVDVVFLDMEMGTFHGLQFAEKLKVKRPNIEIVFVTAHAQFAIEAFEVTAFDYLLKPVNQKRVQKTIQQLRERRSIGVKENINVEKKKDHLSVQAMRSFHLFDSKNNEVKWRTKKVKELFVYLWHHSPNPVRKSHILEDLWADYPEDRATTLMHTSLYQLRKTIKEIGLSNPVTLMNEQYILNMPITSDVSEMESTINSSDRTYINIETIINLYKGHYLEEENYVWALTKQQKIKGVFLAYVEKYVQSEMGNERPSYLIEIYLEKMMELEPYNERFVYLLADYYGKTKNIGKMIALVEKFKEIWMEELGIDIPVEIYSIYNKHMGYA